ncbi:AAA family ATPase [Aureimonas ureilytica]|uniref:AAA family ATPase n=1 Tax=Aureimonas ureilytica TaxID=401562 RepID=UPI0003744E79|nr:AAA family ATPase [Aureimonas ureilytica]
MDDRLDLARLVAPTAARTTPAVRIADELLRATLAADGASRILEGHSGLVVVHGVTPADASTFQVAAEELIGGTPDKPFALDLVVRGWTDPDRLRPNHLEGVLLEACTRRRGIIVLTRLRSRIPAVLSTVADAVLPLAGRHALVKDLIVEIAGFVPDDALVRRIRGLPLPYCNLLIRPGTTRERMWTTAGRLRRHVDDDEAPGERARSRRGDASRSQATAATSAPKSVRPERLEDLPGMGEAGRWGLSLAADLADYRAGSLPWDDVESGAVVHGPPGTGKTLFATAVAGSCGLPLLPHSFAAWQARGHLGDLLKAMRAAFDEARRKAPCLLFVDELDSVGSRDAFLGEHASYQRQVINGFLECLDGTVGREGVVVIGATNAVDAIDDAILRPGRLGRLIEVRLPDLDGRTGILRHHLRTDLPDVDLSKIADEIGEVTGASLGQAVREARALARRERRALVEDDLWNALPKGVLLSDDAFRRLCIHEAGHVVVGIELAAVSGLVPSGVSVRRRVRDGHEHRTDFRTVEGLDLTWERMTAQVTVLLGGLAAEEVVLGSRGSGSGGTAAADLVKATRMIQAAECSLGLGSRLASVPLDTLASRMPEIEDARLRRRVESVLAGCLTDARTIIERRRPELEGLATKLAETQHVRLR